MIYWFTGASTQAVTTGAYRAVEFIKENIKLDGAVDEGVASRTARRSSRSARSTPRQGMFNIFLTVFFATLGVRVPRAVLLHRLPDLDRALRAVPGDLHGQRRRRLGQRQEDRRDRAARRRARRCTTPPSSATRSATRSRTRARVAMNPIIKFTTLFGLLAVELAVSLAQTEGTSADRRAVDRVPGDLGVLRVALLLRDADPGRRRRRRSRARSPNRTPTRHKRVGVFRFRMSPRITPRPSGGSRRASGQ